MNKTSLMGCAFLFCAAVTANAADNAFNKTGAGSSYPPGSPLAVNNTDYVDKNGDGCLEMDEIKPDSQLAKRFATRDKNHDGKLCKDEYYFE